MAESNSLPRPAAMTLVGRNDDRTLPPPAFQLSAADTKANNPAPTPSPPPTPTSTPPPSRSILFYSFPAPAPSPPTFPCPTPPPSLTSSQRSSCSTLLDSHLIVQRTILHEKLERLRASFERGFELQGADLRERRGHVERMVGARGADDGKRREWWVREGGRLKGMVCVLSSAGWREVGMEMGAEGDRGGDGVEEKDQGGGWKVQGGEDSGYSDGEGI